jgi:hypothetical protein
MTATVHAFDKSADLIPAGDFRPGPRLVPDAPPVAPLAIPRAIGAAPAIFAEWSPPGATYYTRTEQAADSADARNAAWWRALLGPGALRLTSHPAGMADAAGLKTRRVLVTLAHDDEAPDLVRFDAAPRRARVTVAGMVVDAVLMACPDGVPHYGVADVCPLAQIVRSARKNTAASVPHGRK